MAAVSSLAGAKFGFNLRSEASVVEIQRFEAMVSRNELFDHIKSNCLAIGAFYDAASARTQKLLLNGVILVDGYYFALPVSIGLGGESVTSEELYLALWRGFEGEGYCNGANELISGVEYDVENYQTFVRQGWSKV